MGRRKVEIKRIQDKNCRQVAFCKRRKGLLKKAKEISILCDVDVAVVIISNRGRLHEFSSNNSLRGVWKVYNESKLGEVAHVAKQGYEIPQESPARTTCASFPACGLSVITSLHASLTKVRGEDLISSFISIRLSPASAIQSDITFPPSLFDFSHLRADLATCGRPSKAIIRRTRR
ncbi:hypothetical protein H5410_063111 [Solanum commersonii]|uniref:MADS-box domain-containing protein n=1 Tax=Solanum commersonii TaxID=4109 RepID=A0A9J5WCF0_SOLCO|nr:hypothetical protein H5410_063111 [Solanum commersonii]